MSDSPARSYYSISPQQLLMTPPNQPGRSSSNMTHVSQRRRGSNPAILPPGAVHYLPVFPSDPHARITPGAVLSNTVPPAYARLDAYQNRAVQYLQRRPEHCGAPSIAITLSVGSIPGPYLSQVGMGHVTVDNPDEPLFADKGWSRTQVDFDFPGLGHPYPIVFRINVLVGPEKRPLTRQEFVKEVAGRFMNVMFEARRDLKAGVQGTYVQHLAPGEERWRLDRIKSNQLRLVGLNYYQKNWVPVLAVDF